jgi:hypothetical protein
MTLLLVGVHGALVVFGWRAGMPVWVLGALGLVVGSTCIVDARARRHDRRQLSAIDHRARLIAPLRDAA